MKDVTRMRRTKIVCTIGPATLSTDQLQQLMLAGMNVARLNFSHGTHDEHAQIIADIRALADNMGHPMAILQDLAGPKIRTGPVAAGQVMLATGQTMTLTCRDVPGDAHEVSLTYKDLHREVRAGDTLLLSDGGVELTVRQVDGVDIVCKVVTGGMLGSHKGINLITRSLDIPILTEKDRKDLAFGLSQSVDYIALSFVRSAADVGEVRQIVQDAGYDIPLIAKIEQRAAIDNIDAIMTSLARFARGEPIDTRLRLSSLSSRYHLSDFSRCSVTLPRKSTSLILYWIRGLTR